MNNILYPLCACVAFLGFIYKLRVLRTNHSPAQIALIGNFFFQAATFTVSSPPVWVAISRNVGIVNFSGLLSQSTVILLTACQQLVLLHLTHERRVAWRKAKPRLIALCLILAAMVTLFSMATSSHENPNDFAVSKAQYYPAYLSVYLVGYTVNQVDVGLMGWRFAKVAPSPWLRRGFIVVAISMPLSMVYAGCRAADIIAGQFGVSGHSWEPVAQVSVAVASIVLAIGWTLPDWGRHLSTVWEWANCHWAYRQLSPFHAKVTSQAADVVLDPGPTDIRTRLYRLVVELRDAQWALRTWMSPSVAEEVRQKAVAAGLRGDELAATVEAARLAAALQAKTRGIRPAEHSNSPLEAEPQDLAAELTFQRKVARAFTASPIVSAVLMLTPGSHPSQEHA
ncbi:MAB_1171c family putative transporter [Streptomyces sp. NPDC059679]|uniref:MAB_1171c family putative transporter n=1 Tax=Streptomyces sp. NPDC059679 TaxID=3346903 RepID=UPI0036AC98F8